MQKLTICRLAILSIRDCKVIPGSHLQRALNSLSLEFDEIYDKLNLSKLVEDEK